MNRDPDRAPIDDQAIEQNARLQELGTVTGELLHDLGGVLGVLSGRISLAREEAGLGRIPADELRRIQRDAEALRTMVLDVLDELKGVRPSLESTFPVNATLVGVVNRWMVGAPSVAATLRTSLAPEAEITGPSSFFSRAIGNLLRNAARHARSEIQLTVRPDDSGSAVEIRIEDDGEGIPEALYEVVFKPFMTSVDTGTGLGLSFARWGVERLGGTLTLEPRGTGMGGASFRMVLPLSSMGRRSANKRSVTQPPIFKYEAVDRETPNSSMSPERLPIHPLAGLRVAIVDDEPAVRRTFGRLLQNSGAEAIEVDAGAFGTPSDPVRTLEAAAPDVIILDLQMPPYSGIDIYRSLERLFPELSRRVIFLTGGAPPPADLNRPYLNKMAEWKEVLTAILRMVSPPSGES